ncbi:OmpA family protein, partial [Bacteroidota bacterium]
MQHLNADDFYNKYGYFGGDNFNIHTASFNALPGVPNCCPKFQSGIGNSYYYGFFVEVPGKLFNLPDEFSLVGKLAVSKLDATLIYNEETSINLTGVDEPGVIEHKLESEYLTIGLEPYINYYFSDRFKVSIGARISNLNRADYSQIETLIKPEGRGYFSNTGLRTRNDTTGLIPFKEDYLYFLSAGVSYELPLNNKGNISLCPELLYYYPINSLNKVLDWKSHSIRLGLSLSFKTLEKPKSYKFERFQIIDTIIVKIPGLEQEIVHIGNDEIRLDTLENDEIVIMETIRRSDTLFKAKPAHISAFIQAFKDKYKPRLVLDDLEIEQFELKNSVPVLNYIFFNRNSYEIPERYKLIPHKEGFEFSIDSLMYYKPIEIYYEILNIIGFRMKSNKNAVITLIGCNSGEHEQNDLALSSKRTESVRNYLFNTWSISPDRIKLRYNNLSEDASDDKAEEGIEENQRVEIYSDDINLLKPVIIYQKNYNINHKEVFFIPEIFSDFKITDSEILIFSNDKIVDRISIDYKKNELYSWLIPDTMFNQANINSIGYCIRVKDNQGNTVFSDTGFVEIKYEQKDLFEENKIKKKIVNYKLILFDYNKPDINPENMEIIKYIRDKIDDESEQSGLEVIITGYTDRLGEEDYNKRLSLQRAKNVAESLKIKDVRVIGYGENEILFDNNLPEGRF